MATTSKATATVTLPTDEQILITREFDAPKHLVYKAWTTPELVSRWWSGLRGRVTVAEVVQVGGPAVALDGRGSRLGEGDRRVTVDGRPPGGGRRGPVPPAALCRKPQNPITM